jgi:uncharacterized membrane protein YphA (DoxX/SURF4 family)
MNNGYLLLLPRFYLAMIFGVAVWAKLTAPMKFSAMLGGFLNRVVLENGYGWYQAFVRGVVLPHLSAYASLVIAGELFVAVALLFGVATRLAGVVAIVLLVNYLSAKGLPIWSPASNDAADIVLALIVVAGAAGRVFGVDRMLARRYPRALIW